MVRKPSSQKVESTWAVLGIEEDGPEGIVASRDGAGEPGGLVRWSMA